MRTPEEIRERIAKAEQEIERLKKLPPPLFPTKRRAGSGNPSIQEAIRRQERKIKLLQQEIEDQEETP